MTECWVMDRPGAKGLGPVVLSDSTVRSHSVIGHWQGPVKHDRTRPVKESRFWNLTGNDRTLEVECSVSCSGASGQQMTVEIKRLMLNIVCHVANIKLPDAGSRVRSV